MPVVSCDPVKKRTHKHRALRDLIAIQTLVMSDVQGENCTPRERCLLARAFKELEELKLRLKMKPAPKPIDVTPKRRSPKGAPTFLELPKPPATPTQGGQSNVS